MLLQQLLGLVRAASCLQSLVKLFLLIIGGARPRPRRSSPGDLGLIFHSLFSYPVVLSNTTWPFLRLDKEPLLERDM